MNFNYSYRAFIITSLLFAILFLAFKSIKLSKYEVISEESYNVEYAEEDFIPEEEDLAATSVERVKIETNRAYNEAEKFISELENSRTEPEETAEEKLQEMNKAIGVANNFDNEAEIAKAKAKIKEAREKLSNGTIKKNNNLISGSSRQTTISYSLVNRSALKIPNPVYTCNGFGKVVINIEVNNLGKVTKTGYNKASSTTKNECLIESAIKYAKEARFNTDAGTLSQIGTVTYHFPGQTQ